METSIENQDVEVRTLSSKFTLDLLGKSMFHYDFGRLDGKSDKYYQAYRTILGFGSTFYGRLAKVFSWIYVFPLPEISKFYKAVDTMMSLFRSIIEERKKNKHDDILDNLLAAVADSNGEKLSERELFGNLWIFFAAGHETTATALSWGCLCLATYQDIQEKIYQEIVESIGDTAMPRLEDLEKLSYLDCFIQEVLRLHSPVQMLPTRFTTEDIKFEEYIIPKGVVVGLNINSIHRNRIHWGPEPEKFDPNRFLPENKKGRHNFAYLPFSLGSRQCLGNTFSLIEQKLFLARILQNFRVLPPRHSPIFSVNELIHFFSDVKFFLRFEKR